MDKIKMMAIIVMVAASNVLFIGCGEKSNPTGPGNTTTKKDTSIFLGSWANVFDTTDNPPGTKASKIMHWCYGGTCLSPDTSSYLNDSVVVNLSSGLQYYYSYSKDSIYTYSYLRGSNAHELIGSSWYRISNDSLFNAPETTYVGGQTYVFNPVAVRISKIPIQPKAIQ